MKQALFWTCILSVWFSISVFSQNIDSLLQLTNNQDDSIVYEAYISLAYHEKDSAKIFAYADSSIIIAKKMNNELLIGRGYLKRGINNYNTNSFRLAVTDFLEALNYFNKTDNKTYIADTYYWLAIALKYWGYYPKAIKYAHTGYDYCERNNLTDDYLKFWLVSAYINLAWNNYAEAEIYCDKIIANTDKKMPDEYFAYAILGKGDIYLINNKLDSANIYFTEAEKLFTKINSNYGASLCYRDLGRMYLIMNNFPKALEYYNKALDYFYATNYKRGISELLILQGDYYFQIKNYDKAIELFFARQKLAISMELPEDIYKNYLHISSAYEKKGDIKEALFYYKKYSQTKDSIFNIEKFEQFSELQTKFDTEKKEKLLAIQKTEIEKQNARQGLLYVLLTTGSIILFVGIYFYIQKRKDNTKISIQNSEISKQNLVLEQQNKEIELSHAQITASITYASRIQKAILPKPNILENIFNDFFILYQPRDIVSGDFYFFRLINNRLYLAAADCTGHGVPGAFMSMLGMAILNEIIKNNETYKADEILDLMRTQIKIALQQSGQKGEQQDGMDITFCIIDTLSLNLNFAGANLPLYLFKTQNNNQITVLEPDRQPVGIYHKERTFSHKEISLQKNEIFYIASDGYHSQFGGENKLPMKTKFFKDILLNINTLTLNDQKNILLQKLDLWKADNEQTDDILIIGIRI